MTNGCEKKNSLSYQLYYLNLKKKQPCHGLMSEVCCVLAGLTLGTGIGAGADWTVATPT